MGRTRFPDGITPNTATWNLYRALHDLHERAGLPSPRELGKALKMTHSRVYNVFRGEPLLPNRPILLKIVARLAQLALMPNVEDVVHSFDSLWDAMRPEVHGT